MCSLYNFTPTTHLIRSRWVTSIRTERMQNYKISCINWTTTTTNWCWFELKMSAVELALKNSYRNWQHRETLRCSKCTTKQCSDKIKNTLQNWILNRKSGFKRCGSELLLCCVSHGYGNCVVDGCESTPSKSIRLSVCCVQMWMCMMQESNKCALTV